MNSMSKVTVFGSYVMDLTCQAPHIPSPGETVLAGPFVMGPGGKGFNQAVASKMAGTETTFITKIGRDFYGAYVKESFDRFGLSKDWLFESAKDSTAVALIVVEQGTGQNAIAVAPGACESLTVADVRNAKHAFEGSNVLLTQFESNLDATAEAVALAHRLGAKVLLNPAPYREFDKSLLERVDVIMPNETECAQMTGLDTNDDGQLRKAAAMLSKDVETVIVTLGDRGVYCPQISDDIIPALAVETIDTTGAGDAFAGIFAAYLAKGCELEECVHFARVGAALSTCKFGTSPSMPLLSEIEKAASQRA